MEPNQHLVIFITCGGPGERTKAGFLKPQFNENFIFEIVDKNCITSVFPKLFQQYSGQVIIFSEATNGRFKQVHDFIETEFRGLCPSMVQVVMCDFHPELLGQQQELIHFITGGNEIQVLAKKIREIIK